MNLSKDRRFETGLILVIAGLILAFSPIQELDGSWSSRLINDKIRIHFTAFYDDDYYGEWNCSEIFEKDDFEGLEFNEDDSFKLERDAGVITFEGRLLKNYIHECK